MRDLLRKYPAIGTVGGIALIGIAVAVGFLAMPSGGPDIPDKAWFTVDDGATKFAAAKTLVPPFDYEGKPAAKAIVYRCQRHDKQFINHLERYTPEAKTAMDAAGGDQMKMGATVANGRQVKRPGKGEWVFENEGKAMPVIIPRCPEGDNDQLEGVTP